MYGSPHLGGTFLFIPSRRGRLLSSGSEDATRLGHRKHRVKASVWGSRINAQTKHRLRGIGPDGARQGCTLQLSKRASKWDGDRKCKAIYIIRVEEL